jgi:hypothetical protein
VRVRVVERVDQGQAVAVVEEEGMDAAALLLAEAADSGRDLQRYLPTRFQGAKALSTPCKAGASSG